MLEWWETSIESSYWLSLRSARTSYRADYTIRRARCRIDEAASQVANWLLFSIARVLIVPCFVPSTFMRKRASTREWFGSDNVVCLDHRTMRATRCPSANWGISMEDESDASTPFSDPSKNCSLNICTSTLSCSRIYSQYFLDITLKREKIKEK